MIDVIVSWPQHIDYPLWRRFLNFNRKRFNKVIIVFTQMNMGKDYRDYIKQQLSNVTFIDNDEVSGDWRNIAVNKGLKYSTSEWVWFTEQDFYPRTVFFKQMEEKMKDNQVVGVLQETRLHPCSLLIKREILDKTSKDFSASPPEYDHFGKIQQDLLKLGAKVTTIDPEYWYHMNGLSQNIYLLQTGKEPNYQPQEFKTYCETCLNEPNHPDFYQLFTNYLGGD